MDIQNIESKEILIILGIIWIIVGTIVYENNGITGFGLILLIIGLINKYFKKFIHNH